MNTTALLKLHTDIEQNEFCTNLSQTSWLEQLQTACNIPSCLFRTAKLSREVVKRRVVYVTINTLQLWFHFCDKNGPKNLDSHGSDESFTVLMSMPRTGSVCKFC
jgi:hypothetical protein